MEFNSGKVGGMEFNSGMECSSGMEEFNSGKVVRNSIVVVWSSTVVRLYGVQ